MAVVEIIMLERMLDGVVKGEYSLGWALLPLFRVAAGQPGAPAGVELDPQPGKPLSVPLVQGTPRYLLFRCGRARMCAHRPSCVYLGGVGERVRGYVDARGGGMGAGLR
eukprot:360045-Chlamydomonas_euryale.AAC.15